MTVATPTGNLLLAAAEVDVRAGEASAPPRLRVVAYSGGPMTVGGWGPIVIDVAGVEASDRVAILADHDQRLSGVVGHGSVSIEGGSLVVDGTVTGVGQAAKDVVALARSGFRLQASVGLEALETERIAAGKKVNVNGRVVASGRGLTLVKRGRLREVSVVAIGADRTTSVDVAARRGINGSTGMDANNNDAGAAVMDEAAIRANERERLREIEAVCAAPGSDWGRSAKRVAELKASAIAGDDTASDGEGPRPDRCEAGERSDRGSSGSGTGAGGGGTRRDAVDRLIWQCAGIVGVDPGNLTLRELLVMAEARQRESWSRTASVMAILANTQRDPRRTRPFRPSDFDPFAAKSVEPTGKVGVGVLKTVFIDPLRTVAASQEATS